jgi:hypothetical protein
MEFLAIHAFLDIGRNSFNPFVRIRCTTPKRKGEIDSNRCSIIKRSIGRLPACSSFASLSVLSVKLANSGSSIMNMMDIHVFEFLICLNYLSLFLLLAQPSQWYLPPWYIGNVQGSLMATHHPSAGAVCEWVIAVYFPSFYEAEI